LEQDYQVLKNFVAMMLDKIKKMPRFRSIQWATAIMTLICTPVEARLFEAGLENSQWQVSASELECRLSQPVPGFGNAVFSRQVGQDQDFVLQPANWNITHQSVLIAAEGPAWKPQNRRRSIGQSTVVAAPGQLKIEQRFTGLILDTLEQGLSPRLDFSVPESTTEEVLKVGISSVNFQEAFDQYKACLTAMLPVGYDQVARSAIFFPTNKSGLSPSVIGQLDLIARYAVADKGVSQIFVDGHTDDTGTARINRNLSRVRANSVVNYLVSAGVEKKRIVTRFHGDKYPVMENDTPENRARNRRVTLRLERSY